MLLCPTTRCGHLMNSDYRASGMTRAQVSNVCIVAIADIEG